MKRKKVARMAQQYALQLLFTQTGPNTAKPLARYLYGFPIKRTVIT